MVQDDTVRVEFHRSVNKNEYKDCVAFEDLKELVGNWGYKKEQYERLIEGVNKSCKKEGWRMELIEAPETEKHKTDYVIINKRI